jgi:hypothetical protein
MTKAASRNPRRIQLKSTNWKDTAELIGIAAIVASLIFVGWQMKQDRDIALAATYQERASATVAAAVSQANNPVGISAAIKLYDGRSPEEPIPNGIIRIPEGAPPITYREFYVAATESSAVWFLWDNSHYQYEAGYLPQEHWDRIRAMIRSSVTDGSVTRYVFETGSETYRQTFRDEITAIIAEVDAETLAN